jgi:predicted nucleic acid-binding protein
MPRAVLDTTTILARVYAKDDHHDAGRAILRGIDKGGLPTGEVTDTVTTETLNMVHTRDGAATANDVLDRLVEGAHFELVHAPKSVFEAARQLFRTYQGLSFGDAMIAGYMHHHDREYIYSFDDDFDVVDGVTRLNSAESPFV